MTDSISVDSAVAFAETLEYDCLYRLYTRIQAIVKAKALHHVKTTGKTKPLVANGVSLPPDVVYHKYKFLPPETIDETRLVCRSMYHAASDKRVWTELPDYIYCEGGRLYDKTSSGMASVLSNYSHLTHLKSSSKMSLNTAVGIDTITAMIPNVTHVDLRYADSNQTAVDRLVANLPIKWLGTLGVIPTDLSSLVCLVLRGHDYENADPLTIKSRALRCLVLESHHGSLHGSILENNPNLEVLIAPNASADHRWTSASLKRLSIGSINRQQAIEGLANLEHLDFHRTVVSGVGNQHMSVVYGGLTGGLEAATLGLDLAKCPNLRTQYMDLNMYPEEEVEDTYTPQLHTLVTRNTHWIVNSRLPDLVTLTLDWDHLDMSEVLEPLEDLIATDWAKQIRHLNIRVKESYCNSGIKRRRDQLFGWLFRAMSQLRTLRLVGAELNFIDICLRYDSENKMLREFTLEMVKGEDLYIEPDVIDKLFPNLRFLRLPSFIIEYFCAVRESLKGDFEVQVPLCDKHKMSASFEAQVRLKNAGYYLPMPEPWHHENRITRHIWNDY